MGVASGCGEQEVGVASGSRWNLWVWLLGVVVRRYIDFLILLIPTPLVSVLFYSSIPTFCSFLKCFIYINRHSYAVHVTKVSLRSHAVIPTPPCLGPHLAGRRPQRPPSGNSCGW